MSASPAQLLQELRQLGFRLCDTYPYAHLIGAELREMRPDWWLQYRSERPELADASLRQAANFGFLAYLEERCQEEPYMWEEMLGLLEDFFLAGEAYLLRELKNTVDWYRDQRSQGQNESAA